VVRAIYIEGGGDSKELKSRCREGFRKLLEKAGFGERGRAPHLVACGCRDEVFDHFKIANGALHEGDYVAMLVDSEDPIATLDKTWEHLRAHDNWHKPQTASDEQVLFMTTCMETWIVADRAALNAHYGQGFQENSLLALVNLEGRNRHEVLKSLEDATRGCNKTYAKGKQSFEVLGKLSPETLMSLPSFKRIRLILEQKL
jgi:hypothetical protein